MKKEETALDWKWVGLVALAVTATGVVLTRTRLRADSRFDGIVDRCESAAAELESRLRGAGASHA